MRTSLRCGRRQSPNCGRILPGSESGIAYGRADRIALFAGGAADHRRYARASLGAVFGPWAGIDRDLPESRLVGTPEQVALQFINLVDLGVTDFVLHGLQDEEQLRLFADEVAPLVRNTALRQGARGSANC